MLILPSLQSSWPWCVRATPPSGRVVSAASPACCFQGGAPAAAPEKDALPASVVLFAFSPPPALSSQAISIKMVSFGDLSTDTGIKELDQYLLTRSYISGCVPQLPPCAVQHDAFRACYS